MEITKDTKVIASDYVIAALMDNPLLFVDNDYNFNINDFEDKFHRILFGSVEHLGRNGMGKIAPIDVDQFLKQYKTQYQVFVENNGADYLQDCLEQYIPKKLPYYYNLLKKFSLVQKLDKAGIDVTDIYNPEIVDPDDLSKMYKDFDSMSVNDILLQKETKFISIKEEFGTNSDRVENEMGDGLNELIDELKETPLIGLPSRSRILTTIYRGLRKGCVYMTSAAAGSGKSRIMVGDLTYLSVPEYYDTETQKWVFTGMSEASLLIETELELKEVQTMILACVAGVPEPHILDGKYAPGEEERIRKAAQLIKNSKIYVVAITNYTTDDLINTIKKYYQLYGVQYVFYDYLSENLKILAEGATKSKVSGLRTDQILLSMITALKDCAKTLNIFIETATQLSGDFKNATELDSSYLRAAKSLSDKVDVGAILTAVRESDQPAIDAYCSKGFEIVPNFVVSVYKIRRGSYQNIKVYLKFDRSQCRIYDTFVTDNKGNLIDNIVPTTIQLLLDQTKEEKFGVAFTGDENFTEDTTEDKEICPF